MYVQSYLPGSTVKHGRLSSITSTKSEMIEYAQKCAKQNCYVEIVDGYEMVIFSKGFWYVYDINGLSDKKYKYLKSALKRITLS